MNSLNRTVRPKSIDAKQTRFQAEQDACVLCGTQLEVKAERIQNSTLVREVAECPKCRIRARSKDHQLQ